MNFWIIYKKWKLYLFQVLYSWIIINIINIKYKARAHIIICFKLFLNISLFFKIKAPKTHSC